MDAVLTPLTAPVLANMIELVTANIDNPTELNAIGTAVEDLRLVHENVAGADRATLYRLDTSNASVSAPWVMASAAAGLQWVAICGYACNQAVKIANALSLLDATDHTKIITWVLSSLTTGITLTLKPTSSTSQTLQYPNITATDTLVTLGLASQTLSGTLLLSGTTPSTSTSTGQLQNSGGYAASRQSFFRGVAASSDVSAVAATFFANQSVDPNAFRLGLDFNLSTSGATAGNSSTTIGIQATITGSTANTYATIVGYSSLLSLSSGTYTSAYAYYVRPPSLGGSTTATAVGIQVDAIAGATSNFAIRTNAGIVSLGDTVKCQGGTASSVSVPALQITNNRILTWLDSSAGFTNSGFIWYDGTNILNIGTGNNTRAMFLATGELTLVPTTDTTATSAAALLVAGGAAIKKNLLHAQGRGAGITSTATVAGTVTLTSTSTEIQTFTGSTAGTVIQFPAANLFGAGIAVLYTINNQSSVTVTPTRAGGDTFQGGGTTDPVLAGASTRYASDGSSKWLKI